MAVAVLPKAQLCLVATTALSPSDALDVVRQAAASLKKGSGVNALNFSVLNLGAQINVLRESPNRLVLSITSYDQRFELCTFSARVTGPDSDGKIRLQVGGLETYKTTQQKIFVFIPVAPKSIWGYPTYKSFLDVVVSALSQSDPSAQVSIGTPATT